MIGRLIAMFEALTAADLKQVRPVDQERFAALCRHWAGFAELRNDVTKPGILRDLQDGERGE
jgi:hypothetical protein